MPLDGEIGPFLGRGQDLSVLNGVLDQLARGRGQLVLVEGEAGAGKSRLLAEVLNVAELRGVTILYGAAEELERDRPLGALGYALGLDGGQLDDEREAIRRLLTGEDTGGQPPSLAGSRQLQFRLIDTVTSVIEELAQQGPTLLVVEDLHWADSLTIITLHHVGRRLRHLPLVVLATMRPFPRSEELERVVAQVALANGVHLMLGPLDDDAVRSLVRTYVDAEPGPRLLGLVARAGGNPFYLHELLSSLADAGAIEVVRDVSEVTRTMAPETLRATILRRLSFVSRDTLGIVRVASVLGSSFTVSALAAVLGRKALELVPVLDEAISAGVLGEQEERLAFRHDIVREAIYEGVPLPVRKGLHLQVARTLAAAGAPPAEVAWHFAIGAGPGDAEAVDWIVRAARRLGPFAPARAVDLLRRAVELTDRADRQRDSLLVELVWSLVWTTHFAAARQLASDVLARSTDPAVIGMLHYALAKALQAEGRIADSLRELEHGLAVRGLPDAVRVRLLADLAGRRLHCRDVGGARAAAEAALAESGRIGNPAAGCAALSSLSLLATLQGRLADAEAFGMRAIAVAAQDDTGEAARAMPWVFVAYQRISADRLDDVGAIIRRGQEADEAGAGGAVYHALTALAQYHQGLWDNAIVEAETSLALSEETGARVLSLVAHAVIAHVSVHRGDLATARAAVEAGEAELQVTGPARFGLPWLLWARALLVQATGDSRYALALLEGTSILSCTLGTPAECYELAPDLVELALSAGRTDLAAALTAGIEQLSAGMKTTNVQATAWRCRGLLDADATVLRHAVVSLQSSPRLLERGRAAEEAGRMLARQGSAEAGPYLEQAVETYERLGASRDRARVDAELRRLGVRRGRRGHRARPETGWESLTPAESAVVRLTVEGLTNRAIGQRLFISHRTVATHLSHVFDKLGLSTRVELVAEVARRPQLAGVGASPAGAPPDRAAGSGPKYET